MRVWNFFTVLGLTSSQGEILDELFIWIFSIFVLLLVVLSVVVWITPFFVFLVILLRSELVKQVSRLILLTVVMLLELVLGLVWICKWFGISLKLVMLEASFLESMWISNVFILVFELGLVLLLEFVHSSDKQHDINVTIPLHLVISIVPAILLSSLF